MISGTSPLQFPSIVYHCATWFEEIVMMELSVEIKIRWCLPLKKIIHWLSY